MKEGERETKKGEGNEKRVIAVVVFVK